MVERMHKKLIIAIYWICPVVASIFYLYSDPASFNPEVWSSYTHRIASILGIFSYIWMCFNILIIKLKSNRELKREVEHPPSEPNHGVAWIMEYHTIVATIALLFGGVHALLLLVDGSQFPDEQVYTGTVGLLMFLFFMVLGIIFMTNRLLKNKVIQNVRLTASRMKFTYNLNKSLHNITMAAVFIIFVHTVLSFTASGDSTEAYLMKATYFSFFIFTLLGWISQKLVRRLRLQVLKKELVETFQVKDPAWALKMIKENPSLYACFQCGICAEGCPLASITEGKYNPRKLMKAARLGLKDQLVNSFDHELWICSTCQTCVEKCPQKIELSHILTKIRNEAFENGNAPESFTLQTKTVFDHGLAIPFTPPILNRRKKMNLPEVTVADLDELQKLMKKAHLDMNVLAPPEEAQGGETK